MQKEVYAMNIADHYKSKGDSSKLTIASGTSSICTPCSIKGEDRIAFPEIVADILRKYGVEINPLNFSSVLVSMSWYFERMLKHNITVAELKEMQRLSVDYARRGVIEKLGMQESVRDYRTYKTEKEDNNKRVVDLLKDSKDILFFFSCGINDMFYRLYNDPISAVNFIGNNPIPRNKETLKRIKEGKVLNQVTSDIKRSFDNILTINDKTDIFCLGIYLPKMLYSLAKISKTVEGFGDLVSEFNEKLKDISKNYGATYFDTTFLTNYLAGGGIDFHATQEGHNITSELLLKAIYRKKVLKFGPTTLQNLEGNFKVDNQGIEGMIMDSKKDLSIETEAYRQRPISRLAKKEHLHNIKEHVKYLSIFEDVKQNVHCKKRK